MHYRFWSDVHSKRKSVYLLPWLTFGFIKIFASYKMIKKIKGTHQPMVADLVDTGST